MNKKQKAEEEKRLHRNKLQRERRERTKKVVHKAKALAFANATEKVAARHFLGPQESVVFAGLGRAATPTHASKAGTVNLLEPARTGLESPQPSPIDFARAVPLMVVGDTMTITRPFGVVLRARVDTTGLIEFGINAEPSELEDSSWHAFNTARHEEAIAAAISIAERISRDRATALLGSQGFTLEEAVKTAAPFQQKA